MGPEMSGDLACDLPQREEASVSGRPPVLVDLAGEGVLREAVEPRQPSLASRVRHGMESPDDRDIGLIEHADPIARPTHHLANDANDQSRGRDHEWRVGGEVGGDLDAVAAGSDADSGGAAAVS